VIAPLGASERAAARCTVALLAAVISWFFIIHVSSAATLGEYVFKFLPVMTDGGIASIFDGNAMGDPRPRLLTTLLTYVNIVVRRTLLLRGPIHPSLGINWALYPLCVFLVHRVVRRLTLDNRAALFAAILYAASPALLDTLVDYYVPAKPLANLMMLLAIYGSCLMFPARPGNTSPRTILGCGVVFAAGLLGLLSDETAVFIYLCVPLIFLDKLLGRDTPARSKVMYATAIATSFAVFAFVAFIVVPAINLRLGQVPVDLWTVVTGGVYQAMFLTAKKPVATLITQISPGSLVETILSAHTVPYRLVQHRWTSGNPLPHFFQWRLSDQIGLYVFFVILLLLVSRVRHDAARWRFVTQLFLAFVAFVVVESVLLLRLSPWIVEVNYYAAFSSLFFAMTVAVLTAGLAARRSILAGWAIVVYFAAVQFVNFCDTAQRHPGIAKPSISWTALQEVHRKVEAGKFADVATSTPFPSQPFSYGFELAAAIEHSAGRTIDLQPMKRTDGALLRFIGADKLRDPNIIDPDISVASKKATPLAARGESGRDLAARLVGRTIRGSVGEWDYIRRISAQGKVRERVWRQGLMRLWSRRGTAEIAGNSLCLRFPSYPEQCISRVEQRGEVTYGFAEDGTLITAFTWLPTDIRLPADLADQ
jgi:hypothetical protein